MIIIDIPNTSDFRKQELQLDAGLLEAQQVPLVFRMVNALVVLGSLLQMVPVLYVFHYSVAILAHLCTQQLDGSLFRPSMLLQRPTLLVEIIWILFQFQKGNLLLNNRMRKFRGEHKAFRRIRLLQLLVLCFFRWPTNVLGLLLHWFAQRRRIWLRVFCFKKAFLLIGRHFKASAAGALVWIDLHYDGIRIFVYLLKQ